MDKLDVIIPDQVRAELERNLSGDDMRQFYRLLLRSRATVDFDKVPLHLIAVFEKMGLRKGDAEIGAFCEWRHIDVMVSYNRDFLRGISSGYSFAVKSPRESRETLDG
ncbi:MAG: type II toxin-antitoxin system VapC family toxin [Caldilineaceae bacterium]|nr:type II toxin-antitoxin system VapC family toxin [Caldilineaceae bacterium]